MSHVPLFWLVALVLVAATVAALVWPLLRPRAARAPDDDGAATAVYRDQKRQLDDELAARAITRTERDAQLEELAARFGDELSSMSATATPITPRSSYVAALVLVAVIPATALLLYMAFGRPALVERATPAAQQPALTHEQIETMVDKLATRMKEHPDDPVGWRLLARAYASMGRFPEAVAGFTEAAHRGPEDATLLADWADALAMRNQSLQGEPSTLIARALTLDPRDPKALSLAATAALERQDYAGAIAQWRKLQAQFPPGSDEARQLDAMIAEASAAASKSGRSAPAAPSADAAPATAAASAPVTGAGTSTAPPWSAAAAAPGTGAETSTAPPASAAAPAISGRVSLDPALRERAGATDTLFIFARAVNGPRMPLAVVRATAGELPRDFRLDDSMAMSPITRLSSATEVIVEARISRSGSATPAPGDLQGASPPVKPGAHDVTIVIDDIVR